MFASTSGGARDDRCSDAVIAYTCMYYIASHASHRFPLAAHLHCQKFCVMARYLMLDARQCNGCNLLANAYNYIIIKRLRMHAAAANVFVIVQNFY
jgi:hypothetical protein